MVLKRGCGGGRRGVLFFTADIVRVPGGFLFAKAGQYLFLFFQDVNS
mgnify:CR=1 FL=1|jgi:hypothetical protein